MKKLANWDIKEFNSFSNIKPDNVLAVRDEVINDGLIYLKHIKPIFIDSMSQVMKFFDTWDESNDTVDKFKANVESSEKQLKDFKNMFDANNMLLEQFKNQAS